MALIKCVECGNSVSDKASFCPNCGAPVSISIPRNSVNVGQQNMQRNVVQNQQRPQVVNANTRKVVPQKKSNSGAVIAGIVGGIIALIILLNGISVSQNKKSAQVIIDEINAIGVVTEDSLPAIQKAQNDYKDADSSVRDYVKNYGDLKKAAEDYKELIDRKGIENVEQLIRNIGTVEYNDESIARIDKAEEAYNELSYDQRKQVANYEDIRSARDRYSELEDEYNKENGIVVTSSGDKYTLDILVNDSSEFKASCEKVSYNDLTTNPELYESKNICVEVKIIRVDADGWIMQGTQLAQMEGSSSKVIALSDERLVRSPRFVEGQSITLYGTGGGTRKLRGAGVGGTLSDIWTGDSGDQIPCISIKYTSKDSYEDWMSILEADDNDYHVAR